MQEQQKSPDPPMQEKKSRLDKMKIAAVFLPAMNTLNGGLGGPGFLRESMLLTISYKLSMRLLNMNCSKLKDLIICYIMQPAAPRAADT